MQQLQKNQQTKITNQTKYITLANNAADISAYMGGPSLSESLNTLIANVKTEYIFIGKNLTHFENDSSFERLLHMVTETDVDVAGGAMRNLSGHWQHGCLQLQMRNYGLKLEYGYHKSIKECMYCDYI